MKQPGKSGVAGGTRRIEPNEQIKRVAILGTGALGGFYGGLLAKAGCDVHFLLNSDFEHVQAHGLKVDTPLGDFHLPQVQAYGRPEDMPKADLAVVAWKTTVDERVLSDVLNNVCGSETIVLVLQNGLDVEEQAASIVGPERVLGGCAFLCSNKIGPGHIRHLDYGAIAFGEYSSTLRGEVSERMKHIAELFQGCGIDMRPSENLLEVRWKKLAWNIPFNGLSVVLSADTQQIMEDPASRELAEDLMVEVKNSAAANGIEISEKHIQKMLDDTSAMVPYDSSMRVDFVQRRPIEVEAIFGNPLRAAKKAGYEPRKIEMLYQQLCFADRLNRSESA